MRSGLKHMLNRELSRGWGGFQAQRAVGLDKRWRQQRCLAHAALREVSIGWRTWCEYANSCHTFLDELHEGLKHLVNRNLRAGLNTWVAAVEEKREEQARLAEPMRKGVARMMHRHLAMCYSCWAEQAHGYAAMRNGLKHLLNRCLLYTSPSPRD